MFGLLPWWCGGSSQGELIYGVSANLTWYQLTKPKKQTNKQNNNNKLQQQQQQQPKQQQQLHVMLKISVRIEPVYPSKYCIFGNPNLIHQARVIFREVDVVKVYDIATRAGWGFLIPFASISVTLIWLFS